MSLKNKVILVIVIFAAGAAVGRFTLPQKVVETQKVVYQDRVVEKMVENKDTKKKSNKVFTRTETDNKDGSKVIITKVEDKTDSDVDIKTKEDKKDDVVKEDDKSKETIYSTQKWTIGALAGFNLSNLQSGVSPTPGVFVDYKILGPFSVTGVGFLNGQIAGGIGFSF